MKIALTFDDGPCEKTKLVLDVLKKYRVPATFFVLGKKIEGNQEILKQMIKQKYEIENHCYTHKYWLKVIFKPISFWTKEISETDKKLSRIGIKTKFVRFPYFERGLRGTAAAKQLKKQIAEVTLDSLDWFYHSNKERVIKRVLNKTNSDEVIGFHDYLENIGENPNLPEILNRIIPELKKREYQFVTLSKMPKETLKKVTK